jgi:hypothetical protein
MVTSALADGTGDRAQTAERVSNEQLRRFVVDREKLTISSAVDENVVSANSPALSPPREVEAQHPVPVAREGACEFDRAAQILAAGEAVGEHRKCAWRAIQRQLESAGQRMPVRIRERDAMCDWACVR